MPPTRLALIRYKTIDNCLRNRFRKWTIDDLVEACSNALYDIDGKTSGISPRTIQNDLKHMREREHGYNAPIIVVDKKYYTYEDPDFSINNMPLTPHDISMLSEIANLLKQYDGFTQFAGISESLKKIEYKIFAINNPTRNIIEFETNNETRGLVHLNTLYTAVKDKLCIEITYQPFHYEVPVKYIASPYLIKEYKNRWFVFALRHDKEFLTNMALDRIQEINIKTDEFFIESTEFDAKNYFKDMIGVTRFDDKIENVIFWVDNARVRYFETKPLHHSMKMISQDETGAIFSLNVILNNELKFELLGNGDRLKILEPKHLCDEFRERIRRMNDFY